jgi:cation:H+ antiporter
VHPAQHLIQKDKPTVISSIISLILGLIGLYLGGEWLVSGASRLARSMGIPALIVGLTVVSIGTSAPELLVSVSAALSGSSDISVGNVVGSNIANVGLILGVSGLIYPIRVNVTLLRRQIPIMLGVIIGAFLLVRDGTVSQADGALLLVGLVVFIGFMIVSSRREKRDMPDEPDEPEYDIPPAEVKRGREALRVLVGMVVLMAGAQFTVGGATTIARSVGISELIIGVTLVALGTSLPELVTSVMAALRQQSDIAIGNVVGSNIFNMLAILGTTSAIQSIDVPLHVIQFDMPVMIAFSLLVVPFALDRSLGRRESVFFLVAYIAYTAYSVLGL